MSNKKLYVGNLPFTATRDEIRAAFEAFGTVYEVSLIEDRQTGRPRGFGFVEMDEAGAGGHRRPRRKGFGGRNLTVNVAREKRERGGGGGRY